MYQKTIQIILILMGKDSRYNINSENAEHLNRCFDFFNAEMRCRDVLKPSADGCAGIAFPVRYQGKRSITECLE